MHKHLKVNPLRLFVLLVLVYYLVFPLMACTMIYYPTKDVTKPYTNVQNIFIKTPDNIKLNAWYVKAQKNKPTIIFCHGNGGNISYYEYIVDLLSAKGYGIILFDYRGYGKSSGFPSEKGLYTDLNSVINFLEVKEKIPQEKIILWGLSLGGAVVTEIASKHNFKAVILQSTFTCIKDEATQKAEQSFSKLYLLNDIMKLAAQNLIYYQKYDSINKINKVECPLLIAHSMNDDVVSYKNSIALSKVNKKAKLYISKEGGHNEHFWFDKESLDFLESVSKNTK